MKKLISFLSYHNAVPFVLGVLFLGGASAFAATATGVLSLPTLPASPPEPVHVDTSALLSANLDTFDFSPTVTNVVETDTEYTVSYSLRTLAPQGSTWAPYAKTGEFSVAKSALPDTGLQGYVVHKLQDVENGERSYLARAQAAEKELAAKQSAQPANAFSSLVGLALNQIPVPVVEKPAPAPQPEAPPVQNAVPQTTEETTAASTATSSASATASPQAATSTATSTTPAASSTASTTPDTIASSATSESPAPTPTAPASTTAPQSASSTNSTDSRPDTSASSTPIN